MTHASSRDDLSLEPCLVAEEQLWSWIDRRAPELEEHLDACAHCRQRARELNGLIDAVSSEAGWTAPPIPERVGPFRVLRVLGEGGMGIVYEAEQSDPERLVAVKVLKGGVDAGETTRRLFAREVRSLALLHHPSIASIYQAGRTDDGHRWFAMERVEGTPIVAASRDLPLRDKVTLLVSVCRAVHYAHTRGVFHRDLKPGNILVSEREGRLEVKILDFGLARIASDDASRSLSGSGRLLGTLPYMSPEQLRGASEDLDSLTDVYSLGVLLFEVLSGQLPYASSPTSLASAVHAICDEPPLALGQVAEGLGRDLEDVAARALEKVRGRRFSSAAALADELDRYLAGLPVLSRPPSLPYVAGKLVRRNPAVSVLTGAVLALILVVGLLNTFRASQLTHAAEVTAGLNLDVAELMVQMTRLLDRTNIALVSHELVDDIAGKIDVLEVSASYRATLHRMVGELYREMGAEGPSLAHLERAITLFTEEEDPVSAADAWRVRASAHASFDDPHEAELAARSGLVVLGEPSGERYPLAAQLLGTLASALAAQGRAQEAREATAEFLAAGCPKDRWVRKRAYLQLRVTTSVIDLDLGEAERALAAADEVLELVRKPAKRMKFQAERLQARAWLMRGWALRELGDSPERACREAYDEALRIHEEELTGDEVAMATMRLGYAKMLLHYGHAADLDRAERFLAAAASLYAELPFPREERIEEIAAARRRLETLREG